ncbi:PREDICTED: probable ATP-dependent RNA helicase DHX34 [Amphimedon queenslandica]|uniref:RNA helicase n=1 Tax=Amphimedon queenslandica TaxID=400682 RepID=A0A1X7UVC6_AMPQE|nr:PREDICTED: probable ATP-dependent RNA helicase DHX34 [Amphimedon queenslandica]|eukprot:XP_019852260.1 PREDICTED: probable ATP-dependent RNA helicase DHX34 [Amphimedon queenslandica]
MGGAKLYTCIVMDWSKQEKDLDRIFFKNFSLIQRGSQEHKDFWKFFYRYQKFNASKEKTKAEKNVEWSASSEGESSKDPFSFPPVYDRSHRICFNVETDNLEYQLRVLQQRREDERKKSSPLTLKHLLEFRSVIRHFLNFQQKTKFQRIQKIIRDQSELPIYQFKDQILSAVRDNQVVLIAGDTGCGKSTQVPQYLLRGSYEKIACTQPRRIACLSLAKRVSYETLNEYRTEIAYQVRFERSRTPATKVLFLTEGLLLRQLSTDRDLSRYDVIIIDEVHERHINSDFLLGVLRILIDQRSDLKLILMSATINISLFSDYFQGAPVIKVPGRLYPIDLQYMPISNASVLQPTAQKSSKLDPQPYLRILQLIDNKYPRSERGDVLVFLSGMNEIASLLHEVKSYGEATGRWIGLPLHSALSIEEQDKVFDVAPDGTRKCIISTNIAETSITIDGIRFVIDSGKVKEMGYDSHTKMNRLQEFWISQASSEQRKGRAGRTGPGVCFRLYSESDYSSFPEYATPEIQRVPLESLVLQTIALDLGNIRKFPFIESPSLSSIETSVAFLKEQDALTNDERLTPVGKMLAQLPVDVVIGKMLIMGSLFHVIEPVLIIAAGLSVQSPFTQTAFNQDESSAQSTRQSLESDHGDPYTLLNAFDEWINVKRDGVKASSQWCKRRGIEEQRLYEMVKLRQQFRDVLLDHELLEREFHEASGEEEERERKSRWFQLSEVQQEELRSMRKRHRTENKQRKVLKMDHEVDEEEEVSIAAGLKHLEFKLLHDLSQLQDGSSERRSYSLRDINLLKIVICSGLYPQVAIGDDCNTFKKGSEQIFHTKSKSFLVLHPTSVFSSNPDLLFQQQEGGKKVHYLLAYEKLLETNRPYMVNALKVPALQTLLLFTQSIDTNESCSRLVVDEWLEIVFTGEDTGQEVMSIVQTLRGTWSRILEMKLAKKSKRDDEDDDQGRESDEIQSLERLLGSRLAEFLDSDYNYTLSQISSSIRPHLYKGPSSTSTTSGGEGGGTKGLPGKLTVGSSKSSPSPHPTKGGFMITHYFTYDCLVDPSQAEASSSLSQHLRNVWVCPSCHQSLVVNMAEQLSHRGECEIEQQAKRKEEKRKEEERAVINTREYHCKECDRVFQFTSIEILRHKRQHKQN